MLLRPECLPALCEQRAHPTPGAQQVLEEGESLSLKKGTCKKERKYTFGKKRDWRCGSEVEHS